MAWTTATTDLRAFLNDGPTDKLRWRKRVFGTPNGTNLSFKTLEMKRITDFTTGSTYPLGIFSNDSITPLAVSADFPLSGDFTLSGTPPADGDVIYASYYVQWFLDTDLEVFLREACQWVLSTTTPGTIPDGLQPAVMRYAASGAYEKLGFRYLEKLSETFALEDQPGDEKNRSGNPFSSMAKQLRDDATKRRDEFYTRQGQSLQPLFGVARGGETNIP